MAFMLMNPGQAAVDRFDPRGHFIKHWVPELRHLRPDQLGLPPVAKGYPAPILDYQQARSQRVEQLQRQRQIFTAQTDLVPYLAPLPTSFMPFGSDRVQCEVGWANLGDCSLFPTAIDLASLDAEQSEVLRSRFVAPVASPAVARAPQQAAAVMPFSLL